jgi:outer membrane lipoprotein-sorting protein
MKRGRSRWLAAAVVPVAAAAGTLTWSLQATAADLPAKTPEEVLTMVLDSNVRAFSGALEQTSQLGLPELPDSGPAADSGLAPALDLITGTHSARVYVDGPANARLQVLDRLAERDVVRQGREVWLYNSRDNTAAHVTLPERAGNSQAQDFGTDGMQTPDQLAHRLLAAVDQSTQVTLGEDTEVAGRTAYELVLDPRSTETLVDSVSIAVDSLTGLPLSVDVQARGQEQPAFKLAFTELRLQAPPDSLFNFTPPPGATVQERTLQEPSMREPGNSNPSRHEQEGRYTVSGEGWESVVELPAASVPEGLAGSELADQLTYAVPGGRALSTALLTVLLTDDGRVLAGSVPLERLQAVAGVR